MSFTIKFSDSTKIDEVVVPDMPPGINNVDTSLSFIGKGYPNYAEKIATNFLHLLENFAGPLPPENPIEGQLWYDTSDPVRKVLRIMDGTATSTRWPTINRIYQQPVDPKDSVSGSLRVGDIWVDTKTNQLSIYYAGEWTLVGPSVSSGIDRTGVEISILEDLAIPPNKLPVVLFYSNNVIAAIISAHNEFVPKVALTGFPTVKKGINLPVIENDRYLLNGLAEKSLNLEINNVSYSADKFLRKDDTIQNGQIITGRILWKTPANQLGSQGRDGIVILSAIENDPTNYIQFYQYENDAIVLNNKSAGKILLKTKPSSNSGLLTTLSLESNSIKLNTSTVVNGSITINGPVSITATSTNAFVVSGDSVIQKKLSVDGEFLVSNSVKIQNTLTLGVSSGNGAIIVPSNTDTYDLGSPTKYFRTLYVSKIVGANHFATGMITMYGSSTTPSNWLLCDGSSYSVNAYPKLFEIIGYTYGNASGNFKVPNLNSVDQNGITIYYIIKT